MNVDNIDFPNRQDLKELAMESVLTEEQAELLINNKIKDAWLLKLKIQIENKTGVIVVLLSDYKKEILDIFSVFSSSPILNKLNTYEKFHNILKSMLDASKSDFDRGISETIGRIIYRSFISSEIERLIPFWKKEKNADSFIVLLDNAFHKELRTPNYSIKADVEMVSSLKFRTENILNKEIQPVRSPFEKKVEIRAKVLTEPRVALSSASVNTLSESTPPSDIPAPKSGTELKMEEIESGFSSVVRCKTVLSPVSGIEFSRLREGQEILITLPYKTDQEKIWANRLGAVGEDGIVHPLIVKFYRYIEMSKGEYYIYAKGPENVLLKAFEERKVRIAVPKDKKTALFEDVSDKLQLNWIFFVSIAGLLLTIGMIILYLSKYS